MTTYFPDNLPPRPDDPENWGVELPGGPGTGEQIEVGEDEFFRMRFLAEAGDAPAAEARVLSWLSHNGQDDLRGAYATATDQPADSGRWEVLAHIPIRY